VKVLSILATFLAASILLAQPAAAAIVLGKEALFEVFKPTEKNRVKDEMYVCKSGTHLSFYFDN